MSTTSYILVILATLCFTASFADETGIVSVSIKNTILTGGEPTEYQQEFVEFNYEAVEWNGEALNWENEWSFEEDGVGEFELTNQFGDSVIIRAHDDDDRNANLAAILGTVVASPAGGLATIASNVGNSITAAHERLENPAVANAASSVESVANNVIVPVVVPAVVSVPIVQSVPESVVVVETVESAPEADNLEVESISEDAEDVIEVTVLFVNAPAEQVVQVVESTPEEIVQVTESTSEQVIQVVESAPEEVAQVVESVQVPEEVVQVEESAPEQVVQVVESAPEEVVPVVENVQGPEEILLAQPSAPEETVQVVESSPEEVVQAVEQTVSQAEGETADTANNTEEVSINAENSAGSTTTTYTESYTYYVTEGNNSAPAQTEVQVVENAVDQAEANVASNEQQQRI